ncbi:U3 small nucleolar ribonucleoprotein protein MPP10 [Protopterus annectens]|uniref:U3 small nucleolar ribonucleoprotein protein MPP10 n=1 Tax=Protopterus annectens TaxID=7888 RepID=UPI001CF9ABCD|nr:U3 small nucleolar ribonucleoprotein protein MPP10 [Protopterus annectens]
MAEGGTCKVFENCLEVFSTTTAQPELFLSVQNGLATSLTSLTKTLYDLHKEQHPSDIVGSPLKELVIENFDEEQIWQELELQNDSVLRYFRKAVAKTVRDDDLQLLSADSDDGDKDKEEEDASADHMEENLLSEDASDAVSEDFDSKKKNKKKESKLKHSEKLSDYDSDVDFDIDELEERTKANKKKTKPGSKSIVDDAFFKLAEMEAFLEDVERKEDRNGKDDDEEDEDTIDYGEDIPSDDDSEDEEQTEVTRRKKLRKHARDLKYKDFFDPIEDDDACNAGDGADADSEQIEDDQEEMEDEDSDEDYYAMEETKEGRKEKEAFKRVAFDLSDDSEGEDVEEILGGKKATESEKKSSFEKRQEKMSEKIKELEKELMAEKPWQLSGEITGEKRPENSLLEETVDFDHAIRMAPVITEETTLQLEDIIKQRIKDQIWDDVVRKEKPKEDVFEYKKRLTLDHEKSKLSLAEVYEQEYLKQTKQKVDTEENPQHVEIQKMMDSLFLKLDALSNFRFIPKPPVPEVKIVSNLPAIMMEEVAPVTVSEAALLAPEEVKAKNKAGDIKGDIEKTATDKKRERRKIKKAKHIRLMQKERKRKLLEKSLGEKGKEPSKKEAAEKLKKMTKEGKVALLKDDGKDKSLKSSQAFFSQLQDQVKMQIKSAKDIKKKDKKRTEIAAHKLKL